VATRPGSGQNAADKALSFITKSKKHTGGIGPMADQAFRKDLTHLRWDEVLARQARRAHLVPAWLTALGLEAGDRVLDVGAGPGYVSVILAERVGAAGTVYALDRSAEALALLKERARNLTQIQPILADACAPDGLALTADKALVTMVLHHADDPRALLRNVAHVLPQGGLTVVAEFHPEGPGEHGPPPEHRIAPATSRDWCAAAGFTEVDYQRQTDEHYMLLLRRT
jgi:SAM-dependent methyltransferase